MARFFDDHDLLVCPTVAVPPFPVEQRFPTEIAGEKLTTYIDWMFLTFVVTLTGCPAISLPCGLTREGLPVGIQLIGRPHGDAELLGAALMLEQALGFARRVPLDVSARRRRVPFAGVSMVPNDLSGASQESLIQSSFCRKS